LAVIMTVLILFSVFLAREILEVRRQTSFIDSVTHELRSPLASIRLGLETSGRSELSPTQREAMRQMMLDDVERLSSLIDDILQATRIEHGDVASELRVVSLHDLAVDCASLVARRHKVAANRIRVEVSPELVVTTDPAAMEIVLKNLLDNALKYSESDGGAIIVSSEVDDASVRVRVRDRGIGIEQKDIKRIFERFYRAPEEAVRSRHGTGLGLFVVSALVKNLGGKLHAESDGPGTGATFVVSLPVRDAPVPSKAATAEASR
jgi:signal transduction histidine kinase